MFTGDGGAVPLHLNLVVKNHKVLGCIDDDTFASMSTSV